MTAANWGVGLFKSLLALRGSALRGSGTTETPKPHPRRYVGNLGSFLSPVSLVA